MFARLYYCVFVNFLSMIVAGISELHTIDPYKRRDVEGIFFIILLICFFLIMLLSFYYFSYHIIYEFYVSSSV